MAKVVVYTDFDGTITKKAGQETILSEFYQSLLSGYMEGVTQNYKEPRLVPAEDVQYLFETKFGPFNEVFDYNQTDAGILMTAEAANFFHELLKQPDVSINIVTRNRKDYIQALFKYQGFSEDEISKLNIMDSGGKFYDVYNNLAQQIQRPSAIYLLDDHGNDCAAMKLAVATAGYLEQTKVHNHEVGTFEWSTYLQEIQSILASAPAPLALALSTANNAVAVDDLSDTHSGIATPINPLAVSRTDSEGADTTPASSIPTYPLPEARTDSEAIDNTNTLVTEQDEEVQEDSIFIPIIGAFIFLIIALGLPVVGIGVVTSLIVASCVVISGYLINAGVEAFLNTLDEEDAIPQGSIQHLQTMGSRQASPLATQNSIAHFPSPLSSGASNEQSQVNLPSSTRSPRN